jgi:hypothetical protein
MGLGLEQAWQFFVVLPGFVYCPTLIFSVRGENWLTKSEKTFTAMTGKLVCTYYDTIERNPTMEA